MYSAWRSTKIPGKKTANHSSVGFKSEMLPSLGALKLKSNRVRLNSNFSWRRLKLPRFPELICHWPAMHCSWWLARLVQVRPLFCMQSWRRTQRWRAHFKLKVKLLMLSKSHSFFQPPWLKIFALVWSMTRSGSIIVFMWLAWTRTWRSWQTVGRL